MMPNRLRVRGEPGRRAHRAVLERAHDADACGPTWASHPDTVQPRGPMRMLRDGEDSAVSCPGGVDTAAFVTVFPMVICRAPAV